MADPNAPETQAATESATQAPTDATESFNEIFSQYERDRKRKKNEDGGKQLEGVCPALPARQNKCRCCDSVA